MFTTGNSERAATGQALAETGIYRGKRGGTPALEIEISEAAADIPLVRVVGEVDLHTCPELRAALQRLTDEGQLRIVLDLAAVPYVDSAALGVLVDAQRRLREKDGEIYLARVAPFVMRAFEITRLIRIFQTRESVEEATELAVEAVLANSRK
jgi:anti-sigma B factor antagonist